MNNGYHSIADGEIALPFGVAGIELDEGLHEGLAALVMVQGSTAGSKVGFNVAQEEIGPVALFLIWNPVAQRNQAFEASLGRGAVPRPRLQLPQEVQALAVIGVEFRGFGIVAKRGLRVVKVGQSAPLAVERCLLLCRSRPRLVELIDFFCQHCLCRLGVATLKSSKGFILAIFRQGFDGGAYVLFDAGFKLSVAGLIAVALRCVLCLQALVEQILQFFNLLVNAGSVPLLPNPIDGRRHSNQDAQNREDKAQLLPGVLAGNPVPNALHQVTSAQRKFHIAPRNA